jgi:hypothetical protein
MGIFEADIFKYLSGNQNARGIVGIADKDCIEVGEIVFPPGPYYDESMLDSCAMSKSKGTSCILQASA